jgi:hypothetical protein
MANASSSSLLGVVVTGASRLSKRRGCNVYKRRQTSELQRGMQRPSDRVVDRAGCLVRTVTEANYLRQSAVRFCFSDLYSRPFAVPIRGSNLPHANTRRQPIPLFLSEFRDFQLTCRNRERTTRMETATGRRI